MLQLNVSEDLGYLPDFLRLAGAKPRECQVDCVKFTVLSADEISTYSEVEVLNQNNYDA